MNKPFCEILFTIRRQLGLTQEQLACELGVSFSTVNRWEKGHTEPSRLAKNRVVSFCIERGVEHVLVDSLRN